MLSYQVFFKYSQRNQTVFFFFFCFSSTCSYFSNFRHSITDPWERETEIAGKASEPHLGGGLAHFRYFRPLWSDASSGRGPCATVGGVMIRFAASGGAPFSGCLLGNLLDCFHLIRPRTLGRGRRGSPEGGCFLRSGGACSFTCSVGVWDVNGGGRGRKNRVTLKVRRREGRGREE